MSILRFRDVEKSLPFGFWLRRKEILRGVSLAVDEGEIYGFLGPNGAGKTTSIKCLLGLLFPDAGAVELFGDPGPTLDARRRLGYLPEQPYFYPHLKGRELVEYFGRLFGLRGAPLRKKCDDLLEMVGLGADADKLTRQYSKGMLQRLGIAQALVNDPDLVILDEPMTGLDPIGRREVKELIHSVKQRGATVFFSSHSLGEVEQLCDRVAIVRAGALVADESLDELRAHAGHQVTIRWPDAAAAAGPPPDFMILEERDGRTWTGMLQGPVDRLIDWLAGRAVDDLSIGRPDLESLFRRYYEPDRMDP